MYAQPPKSSAGGVAIYINNKFDHVKMDDISILHDDFESVWVEIKNKKGKNFLCGCMYCHPNSNVESFLGHNESTLSRFDKNNYHVFLMGDFNIDLLPYESHSHTNDFIKSMISNSLLPYIQQPTRVTVRDNIFSNITDHETLSGNITSLIADHFALFLMIKNCHVNYKSCSYFLHDYSSFGEEKFIYDFSLLHWSSLDNCDISVNDHLNFFS